MLRLRDCVKVVAVCLMPDQIAMDLKLSQVFVEGCARDSCGVLCRLRGKFQAESISICCKVQIQLQAIWAKFFVSFHPIRVLNLQEIAMHRWLVDLNCLLIWISCKRHNKYSPLSLYFRRRE